MEKPRPEVETPKTSLEAEIRRLLSEAAEEAGLELKFVRLGQDRDYLQRLIDKGSLTGLEGDFEITLISGRREKEKTLRTSGYLLVAKRDDGTTSGLVLGAEADHDHRQFRPGAVAEPVFLEITPDEDFVTVCVGRKDGYRHLVPFGDLEKVLAPGGVLRQKIDRIVWDILLDREAIRSHVVGERRSRLAPPPLNLPAGTNVRPRVIRFDPTGAFGRRIQTVRNLSDQIAEGLRGDESVHIDGLSSEEVPVKVGILMGAGAIEIKRLGVELPGMVFGGVHDDEGQRIYWAYSGGRIEGRKLVEVVEDLMSGELNLRVGLVLDLGEGSGRYTVSVMLDYGNDHPVEVAASVVELKVSLGGELARRVFDKTGWQKSQAEKGDVTASRLLWRYFPEDSYGFAKAFWCLLEKTRRTFGSL